MPLLAAFSIVSQGIYFHDVITSIEKFFLNRKNTFTPAEEASQTLCWYMDVRRDQMVQMLLRRKQEWRMKKFRAETWEPSPPLFSVCKILCLCLLRTPPHVRNKLKRNIKNFLNFFSDCFSGSFPLKVLRVFSFRLICIIKMLHGNFWRETETFPRKNKLAKTTKSFHVKAFKKSVGRVIKYFPFSRLICYPEKAFILNFEFVNLQGNFSFGALNRLWWDFDGMQEIEGELQISFFPLHNFLFLFFNGIDRQKCVLKRKRVVKWAEGEKSTWKR